jgi:hypothetical protein
MSRESRIAKRQATLSQLEGEYVAALTRELHACVNGAWGIFGRNDSVVADQNPILREKLTRKSVVELLELGSKIDTIRDELIMEPYHWHKRVLAYRAMTGPSALGEPKLAATLLDEIAAQTKFASG